MNMLMRTGKYTTEGYIKKNDYWTHFRRNTNEEKSNG
jgi:hypothetical protein